MSHPSQQGKKEMEIAEMDVPLSPEECVKLNEKARKLMPIFAKAIRKRSQEQISTVDNDSNSDEVSDLEKSFNELIETYYEILFSYPQYSHYLDVPSRLWGAFQWRIKKIREKIKDLTSINTLTRNLRIQNSINENKCHLELIYSNMLESHQSVIEEYENNLFLEQHNKPHEDTTKFYDLLSVLVFIHIQTGDLHRYLDNKELALQHYERARQLAPGIGNTHNQLAAVARLSQYNISALYYHIRCVMPTHGHLGRNEEEWANVSFKNVKICFRPSNVYNWNARVDDNVDLIKKDTKFYVQRFFIMFWDIHSDLYKKKHAANNFEKKCRRALDLLALLLECSAFEDDLINKLVSINAYAVATSARHSNRNNNKNNVGNYIFAETFALDLGIMLGEKIVAKLRKQKSLVETSTTRPFVMSGFCAFLLICQWQISTCKVTTGNEDDVTHKKQLLATRASFWQIVCAVANELKSNDCYRLQERDIAGKIPKEYKELRGFRPFASFIELKSRFISPQEVSEVFRPFPVKNNDKGGDDDIAKDDGTLTTPDDTRINMAHFLRVLDQHAKPNHVMIRDGMFCISAAHEKNVTKQTTRTTTSALAGDDDNPSNKSDLVEMDTSAGAVSEKVDEDGELVDHSSEELNDLLQTQSQVVQAPTP